MKPFDNINPPKWPLNILRFFLRKEYIEEIEGDMEEMFHDNLEQLPAKKANRIYIWEMVKLLRPSLVKNLEFTQNINQYSMFKNYSKTSFRNLMKNPLSSFINLFGLSMAIGISLIVYSFIEIDLTTDEFHKNKNEVYLSTFFADKDGTLQQYGLSPTPLGDMLAEDFTHVKKICRVEDRGVVLKYEDEVFHEYVRYVDPEFLEMFTFPLKWGLASSLEDINAIIMSEEMSVKYFGQENPIGQDVSMIFEEGESKIFTVTGVAEAFPRAHDVDFKFLINFENIKISNPDFKLDDWTQFVNATLIQVDNPSDLRAIEEGMERYKTLQNAAQNDIVISSFEFVKLADLHKKQIGEIRNSISIGYPPEGRIVLPIIAMLLLTLACFNYINIAIVSAAKRLKEIALRKVIGASRLSVIVQFLTENIIITFFAMSVGLFLGSVVFIPWFNNLFEINLHIDFLDANIWMYLVSLLLFTGIASGIYPAFYISRFQVVNIFGGSVKFGKKNMLTKVFLCVQLILACITIVSGVMFTKNTYYVADRDWGYDQEDVVYARVPDGTTFDQLKNVLTANPNVLSILGSTHHIGRSNSNLVIHMPERQYQVKQFTVDANYIEGMGLQLLEGRLFKEHSQNDKQTIVVNETLIKNMSLQDPLGQSFELDSVKYEIIGVLKDFHAHNFDYQISPTIFRIGDIEDHKYISMRVLAGTEKEIIEAMKTEWASLLPEIPFIGGYQEDVWYGYFKYIDSTAEFMKAIAFIAVLLAGLGLYGLISLNVSGRVREFSIRKILGAKLNDITANITKQYLILVAIALAIGAPVSYLLVGTLFEMVFAYHLPMTYSAVLVSILILLSVLIVVIASQVRKVSRSNPVDGLKVE